MNQPHREITAQALQETIERSPASLQLIDVREYPEYAGGHLLHSMWIPLGKLHQHLDKLDKSKETIVVCFSGKRSAQAQKTLRGHQFDQVAHLKGGLQAWIQGGGAVEKEAKAPWSLERQVRVAAGGLVFGGALLAHFVHDGFLGIPAFVGGGLIFAGITDWCGMGLLIAKMPWNRHAGS